MANDRGFQPILRPARAAEEDDLLEALAARKGIARLQNPEEGGAPRAAATPPAVEAMAAEAMAATPAQAPVAAPAAAPRPEPRRAPAAAERQKPTPRERMKSMNLELPDYAMRALKELALRESCSVRHIIMRALAKEGIAIRPADLIADGRRLRGKNAPV